MRCKPQPEAQWSIDRRSSGVQQHKGERSQHCHRRAQHTMQASKALELLAGRAFSTSATLQAAAPAVAKRSFLASLFGSGSRVDVPLTDALPGVVLPDAIPAPQTAPTTQLTKLSNGMTIATENTPVRRS